MRHLIYAVAFCAIITGCATVENYSDKKYAAKSASAHIEVVNLNNTKRDYEVIGKIDGHLGADIDTLKAKAREMGGDAISIPAEDGLKSQVLVIKWK